MSSNDFGLSGLTRGTQDADRSPPWPSTTPPEGSPPPREVTGQTPDRGPTAWPIAFTGSGSEYFRIWIVNLLLTIVTLTLYYPWAKVRKLRYFYGNTQVAGHALDFHGEPKQMLRGYLLVGALFLVYNFAFQVSPTAAMIALAIMAAIWPMLYRTSMRFRLANTSWRGLRFAFAGDTPGAYKALMPAFVPAILMFVVIAMFAPDAAEGGPVPGAAAQAEAARFGFVFLGIMLLSMLAVPLMWWALKRYQHDHYLLAQERTQFSASIGSFYGVYLKAFGMVVLPIIGMGVLAGIAAGAVKAAGPTAQALFMSAVFTVLILAYVAAILLLQPYLAARLQNLVWNRTASRFVGFESTLRARDLLWLNLKNWVLIVLTLGLYWPFAAVAMAKRKLEAVSVIAHRDLDELVATQRHRMKDATGDAAADVFGVDLGM
jgi:uncharacterized membrane protein YjgN (DUF898 family)